MITEGQIFFPRRSFFAKIRVIRHVVFDYREHHYLLMKNHHLTNVFYLEKLL